MLYLTSKAVYPGSQSPNTKPTLSSILISLFLLTPNKVDYVALVDQIFCICLFLVLYSLFAAFDNSSKVVYFKKH